MKQARKTPNIHIREGSRHSSSRPESTKLKPIPNLNQQRSNVLKKRVELTVNLKKKFLEAENLTQEEQALIKKEAQRNAAKKMKNTEAKIQKSMTSMLEAECSKLGGQVEKEKAQNCRLRFQIMQMRKKIDYLSQKIEKINDAKQKLSKNNDYEQLEKGQFREELTKLRMAYQQIYEEKQAQAKEYEIKIKGLKDEKLKYINLSTELESKVQALMTEKKELVEEIEERTTQYEYLKETFERRKRDWDQKQIEIQGHARQHLDKKGQKIAKFQGQIQNITEKLKEEEIIRKKTTEKNQQLQKDLSRKAEAIRDLEDQISNLKKRVNDLSILKSSNNTIMTQKVQQLTEENLKLNQAIEQLKKRGIIAEEDNKKPFLFGAEDFD